MKAIRLLVVLTVAVLSSVSGYAYEPLVQEGLIWNKSMLEFEDNGKPYEVVKQQYFGKSVEMHGRMYHPLMYEDNVCGYMRQDGDKVYLLVDGEYIPPYNEKLSVGDEVIVYDFAAKTGDKYMSVSLCGDGDLYPNPELVEIFVTKVDTVMVNGHERKRQYLSPHGDSFSSYYIAVEGVGINHGYVHLPQYVLYDGPSWRVSNINFDSMTDAEGNVLFTGADFDTPTPSREVLVQEGLVWNTSHEEYEDNGRPYKVIDSWYFDAPVEMYGKTYHPFKHKDYIFGYMRQDGDKVYLLVDGENISGSWYYNENDSRVELSTGDEVLIYDFGAKEGDKYLTVSMDEQGVFYAYPQMVEVCVVKADTVMVNGHERRRQYLSIWSDEMPSGYIAIEGVGINIGTVHLPQYIILAGPGSRVFHLDNMTDAEGNVLFTNADFRTPTLTREPLVREGVTWNHTEASIYPGSYDSFDSYSFYFDSPVELYGKMYHPLKDRRSESGEVFAYMRQEGNKVYILIDGESVIPPFETMSGEEFAAGDELLLYDFDAKTGDEYWSPSVSDSMTMPYIEALVRVTVTNVDTILVNGVLRKRLMTKADGGGSPEINIVEGIGPSRGYMHIPLYGPLCTCQHTTDAFIKDIVDAEGNVIFRAADFDAPAYSAGIPEVVFDTGMTPAKDNKMYDLNGREIRNPLPGTVYIQNGEKHVAK